MDKKLGVLLLLGLFCVSFVSASNFDNFKYEKDITFDGKDIQGNQLLEKYKPIEIKNSFGLGKTLFEGYLSKHDNVCGQECSSTMEIKLAEDGTLINDIIFKTLQKDESWIEQSVRSYQFSYWGDVDDYETQCVNLKEVCTEHKNGTQCYTPQECNQVKVGSHEGWVDYQIGEEVSGGVYTLKLDAKKKPSRTVDWVIETNGEWLESWATWFSENNYTLAYSNSTEVSTGSTSDVLIKSFESITTYVSNVTSELRKSGGAGGDASIMTIQYLYTNGSQINVSVSNNEVTYLNKSAVNPLNQTLVETINIYLKGTGITAYERNTKVYATLDSIITLNSPEDESISQTNEVTFNATASVTGGATLVNMSLFTNESGSWENTKSINDDAYDNIDDSYINTSLWSTNIITGSGSATIVENTDYIQLISSVACSGSCVDAEAQLDSIAMGDFNERLFGNMTTRISMSRAGSDPSQTTVRFTAFGSTIIQNTNDDSLWTFEKINSTSVNYYNDGSLIGTIVDITDFEITLYSKSKGDVADNNGNMKIYYVNYSLGSSNTAILNQSITDTTLWNVQACDSDGDCGFAPSNYTVHLDTEAPTISVESPSGTLDYNYIGNNETLNVTFTDSSLDTCWYNYNGTNITIEGCLTGVKNSTNFILQEGNYNMTIYANDSLGNFGSELIEWNYKILQLNITYNEEVLDLSLEDFILYVQASEEITASKMNYNEVDYDSSILSLGSGLYKISNSIQIPDVAVDTNHTFFFNITTPTSTFITNSYNQSVFVLLIDNCDSYTNEIFNISLFDEKTLLDLLGTIEVNLELFNNDKSTALTTAVSNFYNMSNMQICSNVNLTDTGYYYDLELRYYVDPTNTSTFLYVPEFYHIQKASTANFPQSLNLYNLNINESTEFTMFYRDNNYVARPNVLLQIERKYISEGIFRTVEIPITSSEGSALGHFDLNNYKYKIIATQDGEILNVFDNPAIVCESELSGICTLTLNGQGSSNPFEDYNTIKDISYVISLDDTEITIDYVIPSGETRQVNVYMFQVSSFRDDLTLCNQTLTSSAGSFFCNANATIGDSNVFIEIRVDGVLESRNKVYYQEDLASYFLLNNYAIAAFFLILLITMMVSSPMIMVATSIFSVALLGFVFLLKGSSIGLVLGSFSWLVVAGILILIKLNKKDET